MRFCTAAFGVMVLVGCALPGGPAAAQNYPPYGPPPAYAPPYGDRPDTVAPGDEDDEAFPPYPPPRGARDPYAPSRSPYGAAYGTQAPGSKAQGDEGYRPPGDVDPNRRQSVAALPPEYQPETGDTKELPPQFRRQMVDYPTREQPGTLIIDTPHTYLYLVLGQGKALRYGIGVGREGFTWSGTEKISRMSEWPDWYPPAEMIQRQPYLPRMMAGGPGNPLGARALYLGNTLYRIHGTNQPSTIGQTVSSGCIRLTNDDIADLYGRVTVGTRVVVLPASAPAAAADFIR